MYDDIFQKQLKKHLVLILNYLIKLGASRQDAEDIVQETALKYIEHVEAVSPEKVKSSLFRVAINKYYDILRRQKVKDKSLIELRIIENFESDLPEDYLLQEEENKDIRTTLDLLPARYKELLILKYIVGLRYEDIAHSFDVTVGTVKSSLFRARQLFIETYRRVKK
ncbi:RNA polymerase sigma factor [Priestia megaterium]|uniref:RNA polymerase sigma factor n=1 Tax=Priestia megaterium TaxID=1404 RepID=UPI001BEBFCDD|nr:RNA polymerase sigma factor [Priestia megaterium]MBT2255918.1 RNA polymerase sigma factor [Priestia megaterium]MBT2280988.1 RNA polymerase sigma factor [Priestia megaterium]